MFDKINSFEIVTLKTSGMRFMLDYEIVMKDGSAQVSMYSVGFHDGEKTHDLVRRAYCAPDRVIKLLNDCRVLSWDGFYGKHPRHVKDGTMFTFEAIVNDGRRISAQGSQNFPRHYRDFTDAVTSILSNVEVYSDERYTLGMENDNIFLDIDGQRLSLTCHPYEPCLYITAADGSQTAVHNSFDPSVVLECFQKGSPVTSITGRKYDALDFCRMVDYAAGMGDTDIDNAEKVFAQQDDNKTAEPTDSGTTDEDVSAVLDEYPDCVIDYCIVKNEKDSVGTDAHRRSLTQACRRLFVDEDGEVIWNITSLGAEAKQIDPAALFASPETGEKLNYKGAFLEPPSGRVYGEKDFDRVNSVLFPNGTDDLEVCQWTTDWSDYFDDGREWWGTLCLTVYDKSLDRFVVIMASATD